MYYYYGFSIKCNHSGIGGSAQEILDQTNLIFGLNNLQKLEFEKDSKGKLHGHGELKFTKKIIYKKYTKKGWHIYIRRIYEHTGWYKYMLKDQDKILH